MTHRALGSLLILVTWTGCKDKPKPSLQTATGSSTPPADTSAPGSADGSTGSEAGSAAGPVSAFVIGATGLGPIDVTVKPTTPGADGEDPLEVYVASVLKPWPELTVRAEIADFSSEIEQEIP
jgi:hypothetical protein